MQTVKYQLETKTKLLKKNLIKSPKLEARLLLAKVLNKTFNWTFTNLEEKISKEEIFSYERLIIKKLKNFPTAYLIGNKEFWSMKFKVNRNALIPRPETEIIIEEIKKSFDIKKSFSILDLGTGTGCILLSLLNEFKNAKGIGTDKNLKIIKLAEKNAQNNNLFGRSKFLNLNWNQKKTFKKLLRINGSFFGKKKFNLIVSNPPYLLKQDMRILMPEVLYEPKMSLYGGLDGLQSYKEIIPELKNILTKHGSIFFEINPVNFENIKKILKQNNFEDIKYIKDLSQKKRFVSGRKI